MGYNARNDEIRDNITRMRREWEAQRGALATVRRFNATLSAKGYVWFWPKIAAALTSKHHLCVPRTSSALISPKNRLTSAHHDCAAVFRTGRLGRAIQVEGPA
jgi:hypothetical protein